MPTRRLLGADQSMIGSQAELWAAVTEGSAITALESKAVYVVGMLRHLIESAGLCLTEGRHLPAYLLAINAAELLGSVVHGRKDKADAIATAGLSFVVGAPTSGDQEVTFAETPHGAYSIRDCINRRHFAAHGGQRFGAGNVLDAELTFRLLRGLVEAMDRWWQGLRDGSVYVRSLANAEIIPLTTGGSVVFIAHLVDPLLDGAMPGGQLQHEGAWRTA